VRGGFLALLAEEPARWLRLDGTRPEDTVFEGLLRGLRDHGVDTDPP